jgi:hypothetical protein
MAEENQEKKDGFAHTIAYYMKLAYSNWHKELVQDDSIRSELDSITGGELEFSNTPFIKHQPQMNQRDDYGRGRGRQNYGRNNRNNQNRNNGRSNNKYKKRY